MARIADIQISESEEELKQYLQNVTTLKQEKHIRMLLLYKSDPLLTRLKVATQLFVSSRSIDRWLSAYKAEGIKKLITKPTRKRSSKIISEEIHKGLEERVNDPKNPFLGYWDAHEWVQEQFNVEVKYNRVRSYMIQHFATKIKRGRKANTDQDPDAIDNFLKNFRVN